MLTLDATTTSLEVVLAGAITTNQLPIVSSWVDKTTTTFTPGKTTTQTNSTSTVTIVAAPAASTQREVHSINIYNADTVTATITVQENDNGTLRILVKITLDVGDTLTFTHAEGWQVIDSSGRKKTTVSSLTVAGSSGDIQYNGGSNTLAAEAAFNYNASTNTLTIDNITIGVGATVPTPTESDNDTSVSSTAFVNANIAGSYSSVGNTSKNNSGTPNTQFDLIAERVTLMNSSGHVVIRLSPGTITNNISTAGSVANGRDQAGAFSASSWIHFYWIWNGTTLASLSSVSATSPTLPSGYTHWAYCGAVRFNGSSQMLKTRFAGAMAFYEAEQTALSTGTANSETAIDLSTFIPPNSLIAILHLNVSNGTANAGSYTSKLRIVTGTDYFILNIGVEVNGSNSQSDGGFLAPNVSQNIYYIQSVTTIRTSLFVMGYMMPNGGD